MYVLRSIPTEKFVSKDGQTLVDNIAEAKLFKTFQRAKEYQTTFTVSPEQIPMHIAEHLMKTQAPPVANLYCIYRPSVGGYVSVKLNQYTTDEGLIRFFASKEAAENCIATELLGDAESYLVREFDPNAQTKPYTPPTPLPPQLDRGTAIFFGAMILLSGDPNLQEEYALEMSERVYLKAKSDASVRD